MAARPDNPAAKTPRRMLSRQELLEAARQIVNEQGYRGASVAAIAVQAGISNGALYRHFPSKVDLFVELFRDVCEREIRSAARAARDVAHPLDKLDAIFENFAARAMRYPRLTWALIAEPVDPAIEEIRLQYRRTYREAIEQLLRTAVEIGAIPEQDTTIAAAALLGGGNEVFAGPLSPMSDSGRDPAEMIRRMTLMMRRALGAPAGPRGQPLGTDPAARSTIAFASTAAGSVP